MSKRVLSTVTSAYRGTVEEQDDTILWLTSMCSGAGLDVAVLLEGSAVTYALRGQDASGLRFADLDVANPPELDHDLEALLAKGVDVYYVEEDAAALALPRDGLVDGLKPVARQELPSLFEGFDQVWQW